MPPPRFPYRTLAELESMSPSRKDGISAALERRMIRSAVNLIIEAGARLSMDVVAISTALVFLHRFFSQASLLRNERFVIAAACLYLAGKAEDSPKSLRDVLWVCYAHRYRGHAAALQRFVDREFYEAARERVFTAERALLYALGFDFNVDHATTALLRLFRPAGTAAGGVAGGAAVAAGPLAEYRNALHRTAPRAALQLAQCSFNFCNDSLKTSLCLQFPGSAIAVACVWLVLKLLRLETRQRLPDGRLWWQAEGVAPWQLGEITRQLLEGVYMAGAGKRVLEDKGLALESVARLTPAQHAAAAQQLGGGGTAARAAAARAGDESVDDLEEMLQELGS